MKTASQKQKAVFLDRDGTLIHDRGFLRMPEEVCFYEQTVPALLDLQRHFKLFIVTNQWGISLGLQRQHEVDAVNRYVVEQLRQHDIFIDKVYTCSHQRYENCDCIKPFPSFALQAANEFGLNLESSYAIGDHPHDAEFGRRFGGTGIFVLSGHGENHRTELRREVPVCRHIGDATQWILNRVKEQDFT